MARPPSHCSPASITCGSVESSTSGTVACVAKRDAISSMSTRAVAADVVDAHVEDVRAFLLLLARHLHARVPVALEHRLAELLRAVGVRALADRQVRDVLVERRERVDRRRARLVHRRAAARASRSRQRLDDGAQVLGRRAAAAADDVTRRAR